MEFQLEFFHILLGVAGAVIMFIFPKLWSAISEKNQIKFDNIDLRLNKGDEKHKEFTEAIQFLRETLIEIKSDIKFIGRNTTNGQWKKRELEQEIKKKQK